MMLSWYRQNAADFGFVRATALLLRVAWRRAFVKTCNSLLPRRVECPCCGWSGNQFHDYIEIGYAIRNIECPVCGSHSRHRGFFLWLTRDYQIQSKSGTALLFAPERALASLWAANPSLTMHRLDIQSGRDVDLIADIMHLPFAPDSARLIWCHHVLEQVSNDLLALDELRRVLKTGTGHLILSVAVNGEVTREFGAADKRLSNNRRSYGADFVKRLHDAGLAVHTLSYGLNQQELARYGVLSETFYMCVKN